MRLKKHNKKINETKSQFFKKINKIGKPLARLIKKKRDGAPINKSDTKKKKVTMDTIEI